MAIDLSGTFWQFVGAMASEERRCTTDEILAAFPEVGEAIRTWRPVLLRPDLLRRVRAGRVPPEASEWDPQLGGYVFENYCSLFAGVGALLDPEDLPTLDRCLSPVLLHMAVCEMADDVERGLALSLTA